MPQQRVRLAALLGVCLLLGGCGLLRSVGLLPKPTPAAQPASAPPPPDDYLLVLRLSAAPDINPDPAGRASPLRVHVYVDEREPRLGEQGFSAVFGTSAEVAEPLDTLIVAPGHSTELVLTPPREATWVTIAAAYREPWSAVWFDTVRVDTGGPTTLTAAFDASAVQLSAVPGP